MTTLPPNGTRDGSFVIFKDWDLKSNDIAYYPNLTGRVDDLKNIVLLNPLATAFNSHGWIKTGPATDYSQWRESPGTDLYVRVEYPGWTFLQGMDSSGNDIDSAPLSGRNIVGNMVHILINFPQAMSDAVAGFNTNGWVKTAISPSLAHFSDFPLDGLYVRTEFPGYEFYQGVDSLGGDLVLTPEHPNDLPALIKASNAHSDSLGFNTNGWIKCGMKVHPPNIISTFGIPTKGTYVRFNWPGFTFLPFLDSLGQNTSYQVSKQIWELVDIALRDQRIVAFNANGEMKNWLNDRPVNMDSRAYPLCGLYVKEPSLVGPNTITFRDIHSTLFIMKGLAILWAKLMISDDQNAAQFFEAAQTVAEDILRRIYLGILPLERAVVEALYIRRALEIHLDMQSFPRSYPLAVMLPGIPYTAVLDTASMALYGKGFASLTSEQAFSASAAAADSLGRPGMEVTEILKASGFISKAFVAIGLMVSAYQAIISDEWKLELSDQVRAWSRSIVTGNIRSGIGPLTGPAGVVLGALVGGVVGSIPGDDMVLLSQWFFGGSSPLPAKEILGSDSLFLATQETVQSQMEWTASNFHVHQVLADQIPKGHVTEDEADLIADIIVSTQSTHTDVEVVATLVWVATPDGVLPFNGANPKELMTLMFWVSRNQLTS